MKHRKMIDGHLEDFSLFQFSRSLLFKSSGNKSPQLIQGVVYSITSPLLNHLMSEKRRDICRQDSLRLIKEFVSSKMMIVLMIVGKRDDWISRGNWNLMQISSSASNHQDTEESHGKSFSHVFFLSSATAYLNWYRSYTKVFKENEIIIKKLVTYPASLFASQHVTSSSWHVMSWHLAPVIKISRKWLLLLKTVAWQEDMMTWGSGKLQCIWHAAASGQGYVHRGDWRWDADAIDTAFAAFTDQICRWWFPHLAVMNC